MSECTHNCSTCSSNCGSRQEPVDLHKPCNELSKIGKVIAVVSGKGGVGKSTVTCSLAAAMAARGKKVGVLDADITGPSVPKAFGIHHRAEGSELGIYPCESEGGIKVMSLNLLTERETDPVVWRGPVIAGAVEQFWTDVIWGELDYLFVDMPPGTGDVPLTVFQSLPVDGVVIVTAPQTLVGMIVTKAVKMAEMMNIPVLGLVENYSFFKCPDCGKEHPIFGESTVDILGAQQNLPVLAKLPLDSALARAVDEGKVEAYQPNPLAGVAELLDK